MPEATTIEHTDRGPLSMDELAAVIARDIPAGSYVNLGIGQPTKIAPTTSRLIRASSCTPRTACSG